MSTEKFEVNQYAHQVVAKKTPALEVMKKLKEENTEFGHFMIAYTLLKMGKLSDEHFITSFAEFREQFESEIEKKYGVGFWYSNKLHMSSEIESALHEFNDYSLLKGDKFK